MTKYWIEQLKDVNLAGIVVTFMEEIRNAYRSSNVKRGRKTSFWKLWRRSEENTKMGLNEVACEGMEWILLGRYTNSCEVF
jgi:hypothetical protein